MVEVPSPGRAPQFLRGRMMSADKGGPQTRPLLFASVPHAVVGLALVACRYTFCPMFRSTIVGLHPLRDAHKSRKQGFEQPEALATRSEETQVKPVALPPGRHRLPTSFSIGTTTIGMFSPFCLAASNGGSPCARNSTAARAQFRRCLSSFPI
jgi:hypothetical protein